MSTFAKKIYVVQKHKGDVIAVKLSFTTAHSIAKRYAPCKVWFGYADKSEDMNAVEYGRDHTE